MRTLLVITAVSALSVSSAEAKSPIKFIEPVFAGNVQNWMKAQIRCMRDAIVTEASIESDEGQRMVGWVVAQRALDNRPDFGGGSICKVVYAVRQNADGTFTSQFSGPVYQAVTLPDDHPALVRAEFNARKVLLGGWKPEEKLRSARFYLRPEHADQRRASWFKKRIFLAKVGNHHFYA